MTTHAQTISGIIKRLATAVCSFKGLVMRKNFQRGAGLTEFSLTIGLIAVLAFASAGLFSISFNHDLTNSSNRIASGGGSEETTIRQSEEPIHAQAGGLEKEESEGGTDAANSNFIE